MVRHIPIPHQLRETSTDIMLNEDDGVHCEKANKSVRRTLTLDLRMDADTRPAITFVPRDRDDDDDDSTEKREEDRGDTLTAKNCAGKALDGMVFSYLRTMFAIPPAPIQPDAAPSTERSSGAKESDEPSTGGGTTCSRRCMCNMRVVHRPLQPPSSAAATATTAAAGNPRQTVNLIKNGSFNVKILM